MEVYTALQHDRFAGSTAEVGPIVVVGMAKNAMEVDLGLGSAESKATAEPK